jgi:hypothetical protein
VSQNAVSRDCIITRHGTDRNSQFTRISSGNVLSLIKRRLDARSLSLTDVSAWKGGYFGFFGTQAGASRLPDPLKKKWRKEYLPTPTALLATALCSSIASYLNRG